MKNLLFGLLTIVFFSNNAIAQVKNTNSTKGEQVESAYLIVKIGDSATEYKYKTIAEFVENSDKIFDSLSSDINSGRLVGNGEDESVCTVTITMSVTVTVEGSVGLAGGSISTTVTGSITVGCDQVVSGGKKLRANLIAAAGG